ncbi:MAG: LytR C-terminal domain-containing protein [candidate division KSB1 bacterium]|nr:LytR C-terminal domain-containing protein [candidate division KSB1 bacterium]MDZ7385055.1 LytR C-terminal domain-containing protein [candidate division KSB1 bacterium]MDZ7392593.1 LytR C-terminal domain-containing protein [candidate division KSB1 bacterium]MDZ7413184.1 LytR C-terminal domain-containing protein [candidate division KSB1 bacterium]
MQRARVYGRKRVAPRRPSGPGGRRPRTSSTTLVMVVIIVCVNILLTGFLIFRGLRKLPPTRISGHQSLDAGVVVAVMNGCGVPGVAQQVSDYLKANRFVASHQNWRNFDVERTVVLDRVSDKKEKARRVASALGLGNEDVLVQLDPSAGCDVTVVLGRDYQRLAPFRR